MTPGSDYEGSGREAPEFALEIRNLSCSFGAIKAVRDVSISVPPGQFLGLIGPNGAGKSTLIECISGYNRNYAGEVLVYGDRVSRRRPEVVARRGVVRGHQSARAFRQMSCLANVAVSSPDPVGERVTHALFGRWRKDDAEVLAESGALLHRLGLQEVVANYASELSGGQQRLLELARLIMTRPKVIVLDEPFVGVSPANRARLVAILRSLVDEEGVTAVMVEHRLDLVESLCDEVVVMAEGAVLASGTMAALRENPEVLRAYLGRVT